MRKFLTLFGLIALFAIPLFAQTHTTATVEDTQTISGNKTFSGSLTVTGNGAAGNAAIKNSSTDAVQYVSSTGSDTNDGLSWGTAKANISAAVAALPVDYGNGKAMGSVYVACGVKIPSGKEVTIGPFTKLHQTPCQTVSRSGGITYSGTSTAITCTDAPTTYNGDGGIFDVNLIVSNNAGSGIAINECTWFKLLQVQIIGPGSSSTGIPLLFNNTQKWTEQTNLDLVHISNFACPSVGCVSFQNNCGGQPALCSSFAYGRWRHVVVSPLRGVAFGEQTATSIQGGDWEIQCFGNGTTAITCWQSVGTASVGNNQRMKIGGESPAGPSNTSVSLTSGSATFYPMLNMGFNAGTWTASYGSGGHTGLMVKVIASGTVQLPTTPIAAGACGATVQTYVGGTATTTDTLSTSTQSGPGLTDSLLVDRYWVDSSANFNMKQCNPTANPLTPGGLVVNFLVLRPN